MFLFPKVIADEDPSSAEIKSRAHEFLSGSDLTLSGIFDMVAAAGERRLGVLFWNKHFHVFTKRDGVSSFLLFNVKRILNLNDFAEGVPAS